MRGTFTSNGLVAIALLVGACGDNGGGSSVDANPSTDLRPLPAEFATRKAVAYSGYRGATRDIAPTNDQILEDLRLMHDRGIGLIRMFDAGADTQRVLEILAANPALDIKMMLGIWIVGPAESGYATTNQASIDTGVAVATDPAYRDIVLAVSVGNETMIDWSGLKVPPADMAGYLRAVRDRVPQPVTTDDNWAFFRGLSTSNQAFETGVVLAEIDFVSMHTYALADTPWGLWDWRQTAVAEGPARAQAMMDASMVWTRSNFTSVRTYLDQHGYNQMPIVIGETGWKSVASGGEVQRAHPVNQKMYYDALMAWNDEPKTLATPTAIVYFEAFDEPWKRGDDMWGLWNVDRKEKYVLWGGEADGFDAATEEALPTAPNDDAEYYVAPVSSGPVTANRFVVYSDTIGAEDAQPREGGRWSAWENNSTAGATPMTTDAAEGANCLRITPTPLSWGWGMTFALMNSDNLTNFNVAEGRLNFSIKTTYPGKLEVGFFTGAAADGNAVDAYIKLQAGDHGYQNDGAWHDVSIPVPTIAAAAAPAFGQPQTARLDMTMVFNGIVIADRFGVTGNPTGARPEIMIDNVFWSK